MEKSRNMSLFWFLIISLLHLHSKCCVRLYNFIHSINYWKHNGDASPKTMPHLKIIFLRSLYAPERPCTYDWCLSFMFFSCFRTPIHVTPQYFAVIQPVFWHFKAWNPVYYFVVRLLCILSRTVWKTLPDTWNYHHHHHHHHHHNYYYYQ
jgi:hypothetical protein